MKRSLVRGIAAILALGSFGSAQAVPIYLDFTGNISQYYLPGVEGTQPGDVVTGGFTLETDRLISTGPPLSGIQYSFLDFDPSGLTEPLAFLQVGDRDISYPQLEQSYAYIGFVDGCQPDCNLGWSENFSVNVQARDVYTAGYDGLLRSTTLSLMSLAQLPLPDFPYWQTFNSFDGASMTPLDAVTLPTYRLIGSYLESVSSCVAGTCTLQSSAQFSFDVTSLVRGVGTRQVPEPGPLGLMALSLVAAGFMRRRKAAV